MKNVLFDMNHHVRVKITPFGWERYREDFKAVIGRHPEYTIPEDAEGWSEWQLWYLMAIFGKYCGNGVSQQPFGVFIEIPIDEEALS